MTDTRLLLKYILNVLQEATYDIAPT